MNIVIVGAGAQGAPCAAIAARQKNVDKVLLGCSKPGAAEAVQRRLGNAKVAAATLDARDPEARARTIRQAIGHAVIVIDMTPSFFAQGVMKAALALNAHYVNTAACPEHLDQLIQHRPLDLNDEVTAAGRSALLGCGPVRGW